MTKLKHFSNKFSAFIEEKAAHRLEEHSASQAVEHSFWGILGRNDFDRKLEEATWRQGKIGSEVRDFLISEQDLFSRGGKLANTV